MADELIDIYDKNNKLLGSPKMKSEAHRQGLWHRAVHIWIYNDQGQILLQLRAKEKELWPSVWDISVAGHVGAGENEMDSALREIEEEIGIIVERDNLRIVKIIPKEIVYEKMINKEFFYIYFLKFNGKIDDLKLQKEEVAKVEFFDIEKISQGIETTPEKYTPNKEYWLMMIKELKNIFKKQT